MTEMEQLKADVVELTRLMGEKAKAGQAPEVKELSDKLIALQKEVNERKTQFADGSKAAPSGRATKDTEKKLDELFIASALLTRKDGHIDKAAYASILEAPEYRDAVKDAGFVTTAAGSISDANQASDFIPPGFSSLLLSEIWLKLEIAALFNRFNMTSPTFTFPFATDRITPRKGSEASAPTKDKFSTSHIVFTAKKIMCNVDFTDEIEQDSIISILPLVRAKIIESFALGQETSCLNGDTTAGATNINGDISTGNPEDVRLTLNGLRASANANSNTLSFASGNFSADNCRALRTVMGKYGKNPSDLAYIISMKDYNTALGFTGYQALYQYAGAVTTAGELGRLDNIPLIITELLPSTSNGATAGVNASGVTDATAGNNTKNLCGLVNKNAYMWGDRKAFMLETFRNPFTQSYSLIGSQRLDFEKVLADADPTAVFGINYV